MKFGNDSSVNIENNGCNQGVQVGINSGNITVNQGITEDKAKKIMADAVKDSLKVLNEHKDEKQKWFRFDTGKEVSPDELIKNGNITAQLDGNIARAEMILPNNKTVYAEFDVHKNQVSNVVADGFPQEYSISIPSDILIGETSFVCEIEGCRYNGKRYQLKFGGYLLAVYDTTENKLQGIEAKAPAGMKSHINPTEKVVTFIKNEWS